MAQSNYPRRLGRLIDPATGLVERDWAAFFDALATLITGGGGGGAITGLSGDGTASGPGVVPLTLAVTGVTPGAYGNATNVGSFTVDAKGRLTLAANVPITATGAPTAAEYLVGALHAGLSAERLVTNTPTAVWDLATGGQAKVDVQPETVPVAVDAAGALDGDGLTASPLAVRVDNTTIQINGANDLEVIAAASPVRVIGITVDGGGAAITPGLKGYAQCPSSGTISSWTVLADQVGDVEFDVFVDPLASFPPTTSVVAAAPPELVAADSDTDSTLTGWSTAVTAGDVFGFEVISAATLERVTLQIEVTP